MTLAKIIFLILILSSPLYLKAETSLKNFETDGCTLFIDGTFSSPKLWQHCCQEHDLSYWLGGSLENMDAVDKSLHSCIKKAAGDFWATLIYFGVRLGHYSPIKNKYQWGWGWSLKRDKNPLTEKEIKQALEKLKNIELEKIDTHDFFRKKLNQKAL